MPCAPTKEGHEAKQKEQKGPAPKPREPQPVGAR
jgi:hypothetical protein